MTTKKRQEATASSGNTVSEDALTPTRKSVPEAKHWFFTYPNYDLAMMETIATELKKNSEKFAMQEEVGKGGLAHIQGYIHFCYKKKLTALKKIINAHWEIARDPKLSIAYCTKLDTRKVGGKMWLFNIELPYDGRDLITDLRPWQQDIYDMTLTVPDKRKVYWFWEPTGGVGKSSFAKYMAFHRNACVVASGKKTDLLQIIKNHTMKEIFILDLGRSTEERCPYEVIEQLKNGHITCGKYESSVHMFPPPHVIIFSNHLPDTNMLSSDRWVVAEL